MAATGELEKHKKEKLFALFRNNNILAVYLFGSRADGTAFADSDYDFGILLRETPALEKASSIMMEIQDEAAKILNSKIDVVVLNTATIEQKFLIISRGLLLFSEDDNLRTDFEDVTIRDYLDFKPFLDAYRRDVREAIKAGEFYA